MVSTSSDTLFSPDVEIDSTSFTDEDLNLFDLIENFNAPHCEGRHNVEAAPPCSHQVVARFAYCKPSKPLICANIVNYAVKMQRENRICEHCNKPVRDCWQILPVNF